MNNENKYVLAFLGALYVLGGSGGQGRQANSHSGRSGRDVLLCNCHDRWPQITGLFNQVSEF